MLRLKPLWVSTAKAQFSFWKSDTKSVCVVNRNITWAHSHTHTHTQDWLTTHAVRSGWLSQTKSYNSISSSPVNWWVRKYSAGSWWFQSDYRRSRTSVALDPPTFHNKSTSNWLKAFCWKDKQAFSADRCCRGSKGSWWFPFCTCKSIQIFFMKSKYFAFACGLFVTASVCVKACCVLLLVSF